MSADVLQESLTNLEVAREAQRAIYETEGVKLARLEQAIEQLKNTILVVDPANLPKRRDYDGLGVIEAAKKWLSEVGGEHSTTEIANALLERGLRTKSKNFPPTVYATLHNSSDFRRRGTGRDGLWSLKEKR